MRLFRPMLFFVIVIALAASQASAQGRRYRGGRGMGPGMMNQGSVPGVQLTADQRSRIAAIRQETRTKVASIMSNTNLSPAEKQTRAQAAREAGHQKVLDVLTPEQRRQFQSCWVTGICMGPGGGRGMGPGMMNQGSVPGVQLTADQRSRIAAIREQTREQVRAILGDPNLSPAEKQTRAQAAREAGHQKVLDVLTPEQRNQFNRNWSSLNPQQSAANDAPAPPGKAIFDQNCARCHGADGNAVAGWRTRVSNMTLADVQNRIKNGIDGMPAFKGTLTDKQIKEVASYAKSLAAGNNK